MRGRPRAAGLVSAIAAAGVVRPQPGARAETECPDLDFAQCLARINSEFYDASYWVFQVVPYMAKRGIIVGTFGTLEGQRTAVVEAANLHHHLCDAANWHMWDRCTEHCPLAFVVTEPASARMRVCLAASSYSPHDPSQHLNLSHPLNGRELELVAPADGQGCRAGAYPELGAERVAIIPSGGCDPDVKSARVKEAGGAAAIVADFGPGAFDLLRTPRFMGGRSHREDPIPLTQMAAEHYDVAAGITRFHQLTQGSSVGLGGLPSFVSRAHEAVVLLELLRGGGAVRGKFELDCSLPAPPEGAVVEPADDWAGSLPIQGLCDLERTPTLPGGVAADCRASLSLQSAGLTRNFCLLGNNLFPRKLSTFIGKGQAADFELHSAEAHLGFDRCTDHPAFRDTEYGYNCSQWARIMTDSRYGFSTCDDLASALPQTALLGVKAACRRVCSTGVRCGCNAGDWEAAAGTYVAIYPSRNCLPFEMVRHAQAAGVLGVLVLVPDAITIPEIGFGVNGPSAPIDIAVHTFRKEDSDAVRDLLASAGGPAEATLTIRERVDNDPEPPPPTYVLQADDSLSVSTAVIACVAVGVVFAAAACFKCFQGRRYRLGKRERSDRKCQVGLGTATTALSLTLLIAMAAASFSLSVNAGRESTDTALDDGWEALRRTHDNAVANGELLKDQLLDAILVQLAGGVYDKLVQGTMAARETAMLFRSWDGSWSGFKQLVRLMRDMGEVAQGYSAAWHTGVLSENGFFATPFLITDDRPNAERGDGRPHVSVTNRGFVYDLIDTSSSAAGHVLPLREWSPTSYVGRSAGIDLIGQMHNRALPPYLVTGYSAPAPWGVFWTFGNSPLFVLREITAPDGRLLGVAQAWLKDAASVAQDAVPKTVTNQNLSVVVFDLDSGNIITKRVGSARRVIENDGLRGAWADRITVPLRIDAAHEVELNAARGYAAAQWPVSDWSAELDQRDWYNHSASFTVFSFDFDDRTATDSSGEQWRASLREPGGSGAGWQPGARGTRSSLQLRGGASLALDLNLTTDIPHVRDALLTPAGRLVYRLTERLPDGRDAILLRRTVGDAPTVFSRMMREPVLSATWTLALWVRPDTAVPPDRRLLARTPLLFSDSADPETISIALLANARFVMRTPLPGGWGCETEPAADGLPAGVWTHVAVTVDRRYDREDSSVRLDRGSPQRCRVFLNGALLSEGMMGYGIVALNGVRVTQEPYQLGMHLDGQLDEVRMYNTTLEAEDIAGIMSTGELRRHVPSRIWYAQQQQLKQVGGDAVGVRWGLLAMLPRADVMREVDRINELQQLNQSARRVNVEAQFDQGMFEAALVLVVCALFTVVLFMTFNDVLTARPLFTFTRAMAEAAMMKTDNFASAPSLLAEINVMNSAMEVMVRSLQWYKSYLPPSLLAAHAAGAGIEDDQAEHGEADAKCSRQLLPQLAAPKVRGALQCIISQTSGAQREEVDSLMRERFQSCLKAGDKVAAIRLAQCGWDLPPELHAKLPEPEAADDETAEPPTPTAQQRKQSLIERRYTGITMKTGASSAHDEQGTCNRFGDGADVPGESIATVSLFPSGYSAPTPRETVAALSVWHDPKGITYWTSEAIDDVLADFALCHPDPKHEINITLYTYTIEMNKAVVWIAWLGARWRLFPDQDVKSMSSQFQRVELDDDDLMQVGLDALRGCGAAELITTHPCGLHVFGVGGDARIVRYENKQGGDRELSPLKDTVVWVPAPEELVSPSGPFSVTLPAHPPVPPGVLEYITSRDFDAMLTEKTWESHPIKMRGFQRLRDACMAQKNQQRPVERLCQRARDIFSTAPDALDGVGVDPAQLAAALPALYGVKCPSQSPTPAQIAHASELGVLRWRDKHYLLAVTGGPRCVAPLDEGAPSCMQMWRISRAYWPGQPYYLMNAAIRSQQERKFNAELCLGTELSEPLVARQHEHPPAAPAPAYFEAAPGREIANAVWSGIAWNITMHDGGSGSVQDAKLFLQAWGLPQYSALIWHLDMVLRAMPSDTRVGSKGRKGYRGLAGVQLDRSVYCRGKVVTFGAFTSTSDDQGVAAGFAAGDGGAAIFTMFGHSGRFISMWSRFGREKEVLYPPNTLHLVTDALSAEHAAILDKKKLQVFDLSELSIAEAVHHLAKAGTIDVSRDHPNVLKLADLARERAVDGDWVGAARALLQEPEAGEAIERRFAIPVVPKEAVGVVALLFSSSAGSEIGPGIDTSLWSDFFKRAEQLAVSRGARIMATHVGAVLIQVSCNSANGAAHSAVNIAVDLLSGMAKPGTGTTPTERGGFDTLSAEFAVHCGVSIGTVHSGFAGSTAHRVEIADGPAVRRARRMAGYSLRFKVSDVIAEVACTQAAAKAGLITWTMDLVAFDVGSGSREPILCITKPAGKQAIGRQRAQAEHGTIDQRAASKIQEAWNAVMQAGEENTDETARSLQDCIDAIPSSAGEHRSVRALHDAAMQPLTYCHELQASVGWKRRERPASCPRPRGAYRVVPASSPWGNTDKSSQHLCPPP